MTVLLRAQELSKTFGIQTLFDGLNFSIAEGDRTGIIGPNGVGKSTFLKILAGLETPDEGSVTRRKGIHLAYVPQMARFNDDDTVESVVAQAARDGGVPPEAIAGDVAITLGKVGFEEPSQLVSTLSGGWKKRLTLACGLVVDPQVMLLDEPTNHLDTEGVLWLEGILSSSSFTWLLITHDRYFLDRTAKRVMELNPVFEEGYLGVEGGYKSFLEGRAAYIKAQESYRDSLMNKVRRETEWLRQGVKARTTKARYRINAAHALIGELEALKSRTRTKEADVAFTASDRQTRRLIETKKLTKELGDRKIVKDLDLVLSPRKRIGLMGTNGTGKTTLMRMLMQQATPDSGTVNHAPNLRVVYFDQNRTSLDPEMSLHMALSPTGADSVVYQGRSIHILSWASRFKFTRDQMPSPISTLSGGEQARLLIARLMLEPADVLFLDEPTNDLDIPTLEILEDSLMDFAGSLVLVTHDRFMLSRVCTHFIGLDGTGNCHNYGDYEQWERDLKGGNKETLVKKEAPKEKAPKQRTKKLSYKEQREFDMMEETIMEAEGMLEEAQAAANDPTIASNGAALMEAHEALAKAEGEVSRLYERWEELSEKAGAT